MENDLNLFLFKKRKGSFNRSRTSEKKANKLEELVKDSLSETIKIILLVCLMKKCCFFARAVDRELKRLFYKSCFEMESTEGYHFLTSFLPSQNKHWEC